MLLELVPASIMDMLQMGMETNKYVYIVMCTMMI